MEFPAINVMREADALPGISGRGGIGNNQLNFLQRNLQGFGRHLGKNGVGSLANVRPAVV